MFVGVFKLITGLISVLSKMLFFRAVRRASEVGSEQLIVSADFISRAGRIKLQIKY